jgi:photosystem II stability/assembly factor-like uncharacterized protein
MSKGSIMTRRRALTGLAFGGLGLAAPAMPAFALDQRSTFMPATPARLAERSALLGVTTAGDRLVAVGTHGIVLLSDDFGASWRQARDVPTQSTLTAVTFLNAQKGFAAGHDRVILKTEDGGESWTMRYVDVERGGPLLTVAFHDEQHGFAMGGFGLVLESNDGGWRWRERPLRRGEVDDLSLNKILDFGDDLYVAADHGRVYRQSGDGGFVPSQAPTEASFWDAIALPDGALVFCGSGGAIWRTRRDLSSWTELDAPPAEGFTALALTLDGRLAVAGLGGALAFGRPDGDRLVPARQRQKTDYAALIPGPRGQLVLLGDQGVVLAADRP